MSDFNWVLCNCVICWFLFGSIHFSMGNSEHIIATVGPLNTSTTSFTHVRIFNGTPYDASLATDRIWKIDRVNTKFYSCDVDFSRDILYTFDTRTASIELITNIRPRGPDRELHVLHDGVSPSLFLKIAVDWISNNIYWVDPLHQWIAVQPASNWGNDQSLYRVLIDEELENPTSLALDPIEGYLFWSNRRSSVTIERADMFGRNRRILISRGLGYPVAIAVDHSSTDIYWVDFLRDTIERSDYNGRNRKTLVRMSHTSFFDIALYQNSMIVTELDNNRIIFLNKITGIIDTSYEIPNEQFYGVSMLSQINQPSSGNNCDGMNCEDICIGGGTDAAECACRTGHALQSDGRTCLEDEGKYYRSIVISDSTTICRLTMQIVTSSGLYRCLTGAASGINDDVIKYVDVDSNTREYIYSTTYNIFKVGINGTGLQTLTSSTEPITGISLDWTTGNVYWTSGNIDGRIWDLSRQWITSIGTLLYPRNIVVDPHYQNLFWISGHSGTNVIQTSNLNGGKKRTIVTSGQLDDPKSLVLDYQEQRLYWVDEGYVRRCWVDGTNVERIEFESGTAFTNPDLLLIYKEYLLWTEDLTLNTSQLHVVGKTPPFPSVNRLEISFLGKLNNIKVMDPALQKVELGPCSLLNGGCEHICIPVNQGKVCECQFGFQLDRNGQTCSSEHIFDKFILVTDWTHNAIYQVSLENGEVRGLKIESIGSPVGVVYDHIRKIVVWGETEDDIVRTFNLQTSEITIFSESGFLFDVHPDRFALDYSSGNIYYTAIPVGTDGFAGVAVLTKDGKHRKLVENGQYPRAIVVDPKEGIMMWTDHGQEKVWKASMDGSSKDELFVSSDLSFPNGIAIDRLEKVIYVTDGRTNKIHKCSYMTSTPCVVVHQDQDAWLMSIFLSGDYLYYTSWNNPYITRIDKATFIDKVRISNNPELGRLDDLFVYNSNESLQTDHVICSQNDGVGPCSTFCLPKGQDDYICACEDGVNLSNDGQRCENVNPTTTPILSTTFDSDNVTESTQTDLNTIIIIAASVGGGLLIFIVVCVCVVIFCRRSKRKKREEERRQRGYEMRNTPGQAESVIYDSITDDLIDLKTPDRKNQVGRNTNDYLRSGDMNSANLGYERLQNMPGRQPTNTSQGDVAGSRQVFTVSRSQARENQYIDSTNFGASSGSTNPTYDGDQRVDLSSDYLDISTSENTKDYLKPNMAFNDSSSDYLTPMKY